MTFDEFFRQTWPKHWATIKMYNEGSLAVDGFDCIVPRRIQVVAEKAWHARDAEVAEYKKDAERYQFVKRMSSKAFMKLFNRCALENLSFDAAIDKVMKDD